MNAVEFLSRLEKVRPSAKGEWVACCPAHADRSPSLAVKQADDGRILVHCFAGCSFAEVVEAAGVKVEDLFPERSLAGDYAKPLPFNPRTLLRALAFNAQVVAVAATSYAHGQPLELEDVKILQSIAGEMQEYAYLATR